MQNCALAILIAQVLFTILSYNVIWSAIIHYPDSFVANKVIELMNLSNYIITLMSFVALVLSSIVTVNRLDSEKIRSALLTAYCAANFVFYLKVSSNPLANW